MSPDGNRNRTGMVRFIRTLCKQAHVVRRNDIDPREIPLLHHEAIHSRVEAVLRILRNDNTGRDHRTTVVNRRHRYREPEEIDRVPYFNNFLVRSGLNVSWLDWVFDTVL